MYFECFLNFKIYVSLWFFFRLNTFFHSWQIEELEKIGIKSALLQTEDGGQSDKKQWRYFYKMFDKILSGIRYFPRNVNTFNLHWGKNIIWILRLSCQIVWQFSYNVLLVFANSFRNINETAGSRLCFVCTYVIPVRFYNLIRGLVIRTIWIDCEIPVNETPPPLKYKEPKIENLIYLGSWECHPGQFWVCFWNQHVWHV